MNIKGLVARIREEFLDDMEAPYLWSEKHITGALALAERELSLRLFLLHDTTTEAICSIAIALVGGVYPRTCTIDDRIIKIERLKFPGITSPLVQTTTEWLDQHDSGWDEAIGTPSRFVVDADACTITFDRQPVAAGTVKLGVKRLPLIPINQKPTSESPELKQLDDELIHGALKYLYIKPDHELYDAGLSAKWEKQFERDIAQIVQNKAAMNPQTWVGRPERF